MPRATAPHEPRASSVRHSLGNLKLPTNRAGQTQANLLNDLIAQGTLHYLRRYDCFDCRQTQWTVHQTVRTVQNQLRSLNRSGPWMSPALLEYLRLLKRKYYAYGTYLASFSSLPILYKACSQKDVLSAVQSKTIVAMSIKVIDNINDTLHDFDQARLSQFKWLASLCDSRFDFPPYEPDWLRRAENSTYNMNRWVYQNLMEAVGRDSIMFQLFKRDVTDYVTGQVRSFEQKYDKIRDSQINLRDYLRNVATKGFGKLWIDIDFCYLEKALGSLNENSLAAIRMINLSFDLLFRALCVYDDVGDLTEDIDHKIVNAVVILGIERNKCSLDLLFNSTNRETVIGELKRAGVIQDSLELADLIFLKSVQCLSEASKLNPLINCRALMACAKILRLFLLRKLLTKPTLETIRLIRRCFRNTQRIESFISPEIWTYSSLLDDIVQHELSRDIVEVREVSASI